MLERYSQDLEILLKNPAKSSEICCFCDQKNLRPSSGHYVILSFSETF